MLPRSSKLEPRHQFNVIPRTSQFFGGGMVWLLCRGYTQRILNPGDRTSSYIYIYIYIYIYCHPRTDCFVVSQLFTKTRHVERLNLGSKPAQLYFRLSIIPLSQHAIHVSSGNIRHYAVTLVLFYILLYWIPRSSIHWKSFALCEWQPLIPSLECSTLDEGSVYIVIHRQTVSLYHNSSVYIYIYIYKYRYILPTTLQYIYIYIYILPTNYPKMIKSLSRCSDWY